ncbi:MAG: RDD family protein [Actinomycetia bacterium]|nr:RDD family protein [Actinomycetes bacterium]
MPAAFDPPPAGLAARIGARMSDIVVFAWLSFFVLIELDARLFGGDPLGRRPLEIDPTALRTIVIVTGLSLVYEGLPVLFRGATLGKAMVGITIVDGSGQRPGPMAVLIRWLMVYGLVSVPVVGWIMVVVVLAPVLVLKNGRGLHDRFAGTRVVRREPGLGRG